MIQDSYIKDEEGLQRRHKVDTTLQVHFFGKNGKNDLHYEGFYKFMDNLQTEVLELEFYEFSKGNIAITEVDFAKILLRYTYLVGFFLQAQCPKTRDFARPKIRIISDFSIVYRTLTNTICT